LRNLGVLGNSAVKRPTTLTAETQRPQRWRREMKIGHCLGFEAAELSGG